MKKIDRHGSQIIGLTGGIASGKSFVLKCFKKLKFITYSFDKVINDLYQIGKPGYLLVANNFPECVDKQGVNKKLLGDTVFSDAKKIALLESLIHPLIRAEMNEFVSLQRSRGSKITIIIEIPLLFEANPPYIFDYIISTICSVEIRYARAMMRKYMTKEKFDGIISKQVKDVYRKDYSDFLLVTEFNKAHTFKQIKKLVKNGGFKRDCT